MLVSVVVLGNLAKFVDSGEIKISLLSEFQDGLALGGRQEFTFVIQ